MFSFIARVRSRSRREHLGPIARNRRQEIAGHLEVTPHRITRARGVSAIDRQNYRFMLPKHFSNSAGRRHQKASHALEMNPQAVEHFPGANHPEAARQNLMERDVGSVKHCTVICFYGCLGLCQIRRERVLAGATHSAGGLGGDFALKSAADKQSFAHIVDRDARDKGSMPGGHVDKPIISEPT
jgi:hypothetical protein